MKKTEIIKAKMGDQTFEFEMPKGLFRRHGNEKPHMHHSKPHPSKNDKICVVCGKSMVKHYHVCEDCWGFLKESLIKRIRELETEEKKLKDKSKTEDKRRIRNESLSTGTSTKRL